MVDGRLAARLGCSDGQVWTLGIVLVLAVALVPATFGAGLQPRGDVRGQSSAAARPATDAPLVHLPPAHDSTLALSPGLPPIPLPGVAPALTNQQQAPVRPPQPTAPPQPTGSTVSPAVPTVAPTAPEPTSLQMVQAGWYDAGPDAPLRTELTPAGELPISAQAGTPAATAVLRLQGSGTVLILTLDTNAARTNGTAALQLCRNRTSTWTGYDAMPQSVAPPVDGTACVAGDLRGATWHFRLSALGPAAANTGFTLRATAGTFVTTFTRETSS